MLCFKLKRPHYGWITAQLINEYFDEVSDKRHTGTKYRCTEIQNQYNYNYFNTGATIQKFLQIGGTN